MSANRKHAVRVAATAAVIVIALYVVGVIILNIIVVDRLTTEVDSRLSQRLSDVTQLSSVPIDKDRGQDVTKRGSDIDDAPTFLWSVAPSGRITALTAGAPHLPRRTWGTAPVTVSAGSLFRYQAKRLGPDWVVAGQSVAEIPRVRAAIVGPEIALGAALLVGVFVGSLIIGLRALAPLEVVQRRQAEFTADASHELRTPLSVIEAEVDLALRHRRDVPTYEVVLRRIEGEGHRLRKIVDDLLWLARTDGAKQRVAHHVQCDIGVVVAESASRFEALCAQREIQLSVVQDGRGPFVVAASAEDIDRLSGVLVDNAVKHAGAGGRVEVRVRGAGNRVVLEVDDTGPGIPQEEIPLIFDRFHRSTGDSDGTGLGLAIADAVVRTSRGSWVVQRSGLGGARMGVSWRRAGSRRAGGTEAEGEGPGAGHPTRDGEQRRLPMG